MIAITHSERLAKSVVCGRREYGQDEIGNTWQKSLQVVTAGVPIVPALMLVLRE